MIERAAAMVAVAVSGASPGRQKELRVLANACRTIAHRPPTFFPGGDPASLVRPDCGVMNADRAWLVVPGHLDRTLWPFYEADLARGVLTPERALVYIEHLYIAVNAYVPDGLAMSVMVGARC